MYALSAAMFRWVSQLSQAWMERNERWRCKRPAFLSEGTAAAVRPLWFFSLRPAWHDGCDRAGCGDRKYRDERQNSGFTHGGSSSFETVQANSQINFTATMEMRRGSRAPARPARCRRLHPG